MFKNQEDLLVEFSQFLPDANGGTGGGGASYAAAVHNAAANLAGQQQPFGSTGLVNVK